MKIDNVSIILLIVIVMLIDNKFKNSVCSLINKNGIIEGYQNCNQCIKQNCSETNKKAVYNCWDHCGLAEGVGAFLNEC
mgnify:CR=1 FL=1